MLQTVETPSAPSIFTTDGSASPLWGLVFKNLVLIVLTLGIYRFWAKTNVRRFLWRHTLVAGERLEYTGTGGELLKGFLIVFLGVVLPLSLVINLASYLLETGMGSIAIFLWAIGILAFFYLPFCAVFFAVRYRFSRTRWRGIRFALPGSPWAYGRVAAGWWFLQILTLGLLSPVVGVRLWSYVWNQARFGGLAFQFTGTAKGLYRTFLPMVVVAVLWIGAIQMPFVLHFLSPFSESGQRPDYELGYMMGNFAVVLLLSVLFVKFFIRYKVAQMNLLVGGLALGGMVHLKADFPSGALLRLMIGNGLLILLTLGLGVPHASLRGLRFVCAHVSLEGRPDFAAIVQSAEAVPKRGEGLADAFDVSF